MASPAIGIDFGTAYLRVGVFRSNTVEFIPNESQGCKTPIYIAFREDEESNGVYVSAEFGEHAKVTALEHLQNTVFCLKRLIGRSYDEKTDQNHKNCWPFKVINSDKQSLLEVDVRGKKKNLRTVSIFSTILRNAKEFASKYLNTEVNRMVVTIPVKCDQAYKDETMEAAKMAGFIQVDMIEETHAAALAYQVVERKDYLQQIQNIIVFHLGGGSFGVTVFKLCGSDIASVFNDGDPNLGGLNFDAAIVSWYRKKLRIRRGTNSNQDDISITEACEKAKCNLASCNSTKVNTAITSQRGKPYASEVVITRRDIEEIEEVQTLLERINTVMHQAVEAASPIDKAVVILVGGSTRLPCIVDLVKKYPIKQSRILNADEAAVIGAAVCAAGKLPATSFAEDIHDASNKDAPPHLITCANELVLKTPAIEKDEQDRRAKINQIEKTLYRIKRLLQTKSNEEVKELLEKYEELISWTKQDKIASADEIKMMDGQVQELVQKTEVRFLFYCCCSVLLDECVNNYNAWL